MNCLSLPGKPSDIKNLLSLLEKNDLNNFQDALKGLDPGKLINITARYEEYDEQEYNILQHAVIQGRCGFVNALLEHNVNPNISHGNEAPLLLAARYGEHKILEAFMGTIHKVDKKCRINLNKCNYEDQNILHLGTYSFRRTLCK